MPGPASLSAPQADLLRAAFGADASAVASWRRWRDGVDWGAHLPRGEFRLMPAVARNLRRLGADDPLIPRFGGIARQAWVANQHRLLRFQPTLRALVDGGVRLAPLPPDWLLVHDASAVLERTAILACALHPSSVDAATRGLWRLGWRPRPQRARWRLDGDVLVELELPWHDTRDPSLAIALAWQRDTDDAQGRFPAAAWARARPARLANLPVLALDTADALRELGRRPPAGERFDAAVDWMLHLDAARPAGEPARNAPARFRLVGDSRAGIGVADANGDAFGKVAVDPAWQCIIDDLRVILPDVPAVRSTHAARSRGASPPPSRNPGLGARLSAHWYAYRRAFGPGFTWPAAVCRLPGYLMAKWELPSPRRLPIRFWRGLRWEWRNSRSRPR